MYTIDNLSQGKDLFKISVPNKKYLFSKIKLQREIMNTYKNLQLLQKKKMYFELAQKVKRNKSIAHFIIFIKQQKKRWIN